MYRLRMAFVALAFAVGIGLSAQAQHRVSPGAVPHPGSIGGFGGVVSPGGVPHPGGVGNLGNFRRDGFFNGFAVGGFVPTIVVAPYGAYGYPYGFGYPYGYGYGYGYPYGYGYGYGYPYGFGYGYGYPYGYGYYPVPQTTNASGSLINAIRNTTATPSSWNWNW